MPQIITNGSFDPANLQVDDLYIQIVPPPAAPTGVPVDIVAVVGTAPWGPVNAPQLLGTPQNGQAAFGPVTAASVTDPHDLPTEIVQLFAQAPSQAQLSVWASRVTDGTDVPAQANVEDVSSVVGGVIKAIYSGSAGDALQMIISAGSIAGSYNVVIGGFPGLPAELFPNIPNVSGSFWLNLQNALALGLSGIRPPSSFCRFTATGAIAATLALLDSGAADVIDLSAITPGVGGNSIHIAVAAGTSSGTKATVVNGASTYIADNLGESAFSIHYTGANATAAMTVSGTGIVLSAGADSFSLDLSSYSTIAAVVAAINGHPNWTAVLLSANGANPALNGLDFVTAQDVKTSTYTETRNLQAIIQGINNIAGPGGANLVLASRHPGAGDIPANISSTPLSNGGAGSAGAPAIGTTSLTGGTDGRAGVNTAALIGNDETLPKTGLYALRALNPTPGLGYIAGITDDTIIATLQEFGDSEGIAMAWAFATGTTSQQAVAIKQASGVLDWEILWLKDWIYFYDSVNNQVRLIAPYSTILGRTATLPPQVSPGNKSVYGVVGTERSSPYTGSIPYSYAEIGLLESNGILFVTNPIPAGASWGIRHGQNGYPVPPQDDVAYTRMTNYIAHSLESFMGQFVDQPQSQAPNDPTRNAIRTVLNSFFQNLQDLGQIDTQDINGGPGFLVICDLTNNTPASIAARYCFAACRVVYLSNIRFLVVSIQGGTTVVTQGNSQSEALAGQQLAA